MATTWTTAVGNEIQPKLCNHGKKPKFSCPCIMIKTIVLPAWTTSMQEKRTLTGTHGTHATMHIIRQSSPNRLQQRQESMEYTIQLRRDNYSGEELHHLTSLGGQGTMKIGCNDTEIGRLSGLERQSAALNTTLL